MEWSWQLSDDGRHAIVEIGTRGRKALEPFLKNAAVVKAFERGKTTREQLESECRRFRKDFDVDGKDRQKPKSGQQPTEEVIR